MLKNFLIAQNKTELTYLINKNLKNFKVIPLSLETLIFCKLNKIDHIDLEKVLDNSIHREILVTTEKIIKNSSFSYSKYKSLNIELIHWFRFRIYSYLFVYFILKKLKRLSKIKSICVTGWDNLESLYSKNNYFVSSFLKSLFKNVIFLNKNRYKPKREKCLSYYIDKRDQVITSNSKNVILNNLNYNFKRLAFWFFRNGYKTLVFSFTKYNYLKKFLIKLFNIKVIQIISHEKKVIKKITFPKLFFNKRRIDNLIIQDKNKLNILFNNIENKTLAIKEFVQKNKILLAASNIFRGVDGAILEICKEKKISTLNIPHGTLSRNYNKYDKIYKKNISEAIVYKQADLIASQSNISNEFFKQIKIKKNLVYSKNIIFNETSEKYKNPYILYAVTNKDFGNMQFYGVETFYEFFKNLENLEKISLENHLKIIVKPHPTEFGSIKDLKALFPNLIFTKDENKKLFKKIFATVSFSSSIIEDSLNSGVPVILFDKRHRYIHCENEKNVNKFSWIYYVNNNKNFIKCLKKIKVNKNRYRIEKKLENKSKKNIGRLLKHILNEK